MARSLKDANRVPLLAMMAANLVVFYATVKTDAIFGGDWLELARGWQDALPAGVGLILVGIANAQTSAENKARIVFLRWKNPLPGSEAFTRHAASDPRVDLDAIEGAHGPLPTDPREQNALWYRMYKSVADDSSVWQVHREFLFTRDYTCLSLMVLVVLGGAGFFLIPSTQTGLIYLALLVLQYFLTSRAARHHGGRFVTTVLALKGAGQ